MYDFTNKYICIVNTSSSPMSNKLRNKNMDIYSKLHSAGFEIIFLYTNTANSSIHIVKDNNAYYNLSIPTDNSEPNLSLKMWMAYSFFNSLNVKGILKMDDTVYHIDDEIIDLDYYTADYLAIEYDDKISNSYFYYISNKTIKYIVEADINPTSFKQYEYIYIGESLKDKTDLKIYKTNWGTNGYVKCIQCIRLTQEFITTSICDMCDTCDLMRPYNYMKFMNENNCIFDHLRTETTEQVQIPKYINSDSVVLELGARYGTVSCIINKCIGIPTNQVSVEPDQRIQPILYKNMINNGCNFHIINGVISRVPLELTNLNSHDGYATKTIKTSTSLIKSYTIEEIEAEYSLKFNTIVADCEGFLEQFFEENPHLYSQISLILFEMDYKDECNYKKIMDNLIAHNFTRLEGGDHQVWKKLVNNSD